MKTVFIYLYSVFTTTVWVFPKSAALHFYNFFTKHMGNLSCTANSIFPCEVHSLFVFSKSTLVRSRCVNTTKAKTIAVTMGPAGSLGKRGLAIVDTPATTCYAADHGRRQPRLQAQTPTTLNAQASSKLKLKLVRYQPIALEILSLDANGHAGSVVTGFE